MHDRTRAASCPAQLGLWLSLLLAVAASPLAAQHKIIFDTDFVLPPQDDGFALILALHSPEIEILGITTVAGNDSRERATSDVLRMLEIARREDIPVYSGANMPLVHEKSEFATQTHGRWWSDDPPPPPPGGFARKQAETMSAADFIVKTVKQNPGEVIILAIGPLTNLAIAIRQEPGLAGMIKQIVIMGGAIASLPDGGGNVTPNAEFNFWVDPEAAKVVLRSGAPIILSPLNVSRKSVFTLEWYEKLVSVETPLTRLIRERMEPYRDRFSRFRMFMYDQLAVATLIDPSLFTMKELYVDVDRNHDINYGVSVGGEKLWPGAEGAQKIQVEYDLDFDRFIQLYIERMTKPVPGAS